MANGGFSKKNGLKKYGKGKGNEENKKKVLAKLKKKKKEKKKIRYTEEGYRIYTEEELKLGRGKNPKNDKKIKNSTKISPSKNGKKNSSSSQIHNKAESIPF